MMEQFYAQPPTSERTQQDIKKIFADLLSQLNWGGTDDEDGTLQLGKPDYREAKTQLKKILPNHGVIINQVFLNAFSAKNGPDLSQAETAICKLARGEKIDTRLMPYQPEAAVDDILEDIEDTFFARVGKNAESTAAIIIKPLIEKAAAALIKLFPGKQFSIQTILQTCLQTATAPDFTQTKQQFRLLIADIEAKRREEHAENKQQIDQVFLGLHKALKTNAGLNNAITKAERLIADQLPENSANEIHRIFATSLDPDGATPISKTQIDQAWQAILELSQKI